MPGLASSGAPAPPPLPKNPSDGANLAISQGGLTDFFSARTPYEFWLTCLIVLFGLIMTFLFLIHVRRIDSRRTEDVARPIIVITLIVGTLILITAGYNNEQIAPAFGLLGTIAGYILGRLNRPEGDRETQSANNASSTETPN
jgi:predicted PurR-regulated permease PerM